MHAEMLSPQKVGYLVQRIPTQNSVVYSCIACSLAGAEKFDVYGINPMSSLRKNLQGKTLY